MTQDLIGNAGVRLLGNKRKKLLVNMFVFFKGVLGIFNYFS